MKVKRIKRLKLNPGFIKNDNGEITDAYLSIKDFNNIMKYLNDFEKIKAKAQKKRASLK